GPAAPHPRQPARPPADRRHAHGAWWRRDGFPHVALRGEPDQRGAGLLLGGPTGRDRPRRRAGRAGAGRFRFVGRSSRRGHTRLRRQCRPAPTGQQREPGARRRALLAAGWRRAPPQARRPPERNGPGPEPDAQPARHVRLPVAHCPGGRQPCELLARLRACRSGRHRMDRCAVPRGFLAHRRPAAHVRGPTRIGALQRRAALQSRGGLTLRPTDRPDSAAQPPVAPHRFPVDRWGWRGGCADTGSAVTIGPRPNVTTFTRDYAAPHAWRASLGVQRRLLHVFTVSLDASYARGTSQYGFRDRNLVGTPCFTLPDEAGRPVYVPADSIVPATGALGFTASRLHPEFGQVLVIGSDLQSDTRQVTVGVGAGTTRGAAVRLSYTFTRARDQSSFSCCAASHGFAAPTTAANPNAREWATSDLERRHAFLATVTLPIASALELGAIARLTSGAPFTPVVGSDINGDGARNDRAFIFVPAAAPDTAVGNAMRTLIAAAPG